MEGNAYLIRRPPLNDHITLDQSQPNNPIHSPLTGWNRTNHELPLRREEMSIIQDPAQLDRDELVPQRPNIPVQRQSLKVDMRGTKDSSTRRFVASTGLNANEPVLDDIDTSDTVFPSQRIESEEDLDRVGVLLSALDGELRGQAGLEGDGNTFGSGGRVGDRGGQFPHVGGRGGVGVFEDTGFVGDVEEVFVR